MNISSFLILSHSEIKITKKNYSQSYSVRLCEYKKRDNFFDLILRKLYQICIVRKILFTRTPDTKLTPFSNCHQRQVLSSTELVVFSSPPKTWKKIFYQNTFSSVCIWNIFLSFPNAYNDKSLLVYYVLFLQTHHENRWSLKVLTLKNRILQLIICRKKLQKIWKYVKSWKSWKGISLR